MARVPTIKKVQAAMALLRRRISSLTRRQIRKGKPISYGAFGIFLPNEDIRREPNIFSGGN